MSMSNADTHVSSENRSPSAQPRQDVSGGGKSEKTEHSLEEIEKELEELRPKPPSPETKRRMEEEEKKKDREIRHEHHQQLASSPSSTPESRHENKSTEHHANELVPGEPDPTVHEDTKFPVLNDRGEVELKPQQGSVFHRNPGQS